MEEQSPFPRSILGGGQAEGFVAGLVEDRRAVPQVLDALRRAGIGLGDVHVLPGETALEIDASHHPSLASAPCAPGEHEVSQEFIAGTLLGDVLLGVRAPSETEAGTVARVLIDEGVSSVYRFSAGSVRPPLELVGAEPSPFERIA